MCGMCGMFWNGVEDGTSEVTVAVFGQVEEVDFSVGPNNSCISLVFSLSIESQVKSVRQR